VNFKGLCYYLLFPGLIRALIATRTAGLYDNLEAGQKLLTTMSSDRGNEVVWEVCVARSSQVRSRICNAVRLGAGALQRAPRAHCALRPLRHTVGRAGTSEGTPRSGARMAPR